jgi:hypothetical protein
MLACGAIVMHEGVVIIDRNKYHNKGLFIETGAGRLFAAVYFIGGNKIV